MVQQETGSSVSEPPVQTSQQATFAPGTKALSRLLRMPSGGSRVGDFSFFVRARNLWTAHLFCRQRRHWETASFEGRAELCQRLFLWKALASPSLSNQCVGKNISARTGAMERR